MKFWTGVTDNRWYQFLSKQTLLDEVNFWHPSGRPPFKSLPEGTPFLFKLKSPHHHIAGGAYFIKFESLPLRLAWDDFGVKNGAATFSEFEALINAARGRDSDRSRDIGCSILGEPFFFQQKDWIPVAAEFAANIVSGKSFDTQDMNGRRIWSAVQLATASSQQGVRRIAEPMAMYGTPVLVKPRRGQGTFRALVTNAYGRRCAITGESTLPVLEAAHIQPVSSGGQHYTSNGLLLRSDFHKLFDEGLITITPHLRLEVSSRIKEQWFNGKAYNRLHGEQLTSLPGAADDKPNPLFLQWHNDNRYERGA